MRSIKVGKQSKVAAASSAGQGSLGFGAKYTQRELPHETHHGVASEAEATPGPGQYDPRVTEVGGNLAVDAMSKDTFSTSAKAGKAGFLANSAAHGGDIATDKNNVTIDRAESRCSYSRCGTRGWACAASCSI